MLDYDKYIVAFSGGKDSTACFLHLLDLGVPKHKIELWHHEIDGRGEQFMDWECTKSYCEAFAAHFDVPIYFSWKEGGFKREMLRNNAKTAPTSFEIPGGNIVTVGGTRGKDATRLKFPQVSPDLKVRWCSAYLKIDVMAAAIRNQDRFNGIKTLVLSGERGEESSARSKYAVLERDKGDGRGGKAKRHVDRWRPIRDWSESQVWKIIEKYSIRVHPAYYLGYNRVSCKWCIFGNKNQFATSYKISPEQGENIMQYEDTFGCTIKRNISLRNLISSGSAYTSLDPEMVKAATSYNYTLSIIINQWFLPAGAYGESCGPV
jgi:3'-phosphoadenosine 5'-phosphosulfate sulfotransferase (PAPS reductase)/FAD synthetase